MAIKKKVFISFDFDNDRVLKEFIIGQAALSDSPFEVQDVSLKEAAPERSWELKAKAAIARSDQFIVMLGPTTARASGVLKEVRFARELKIPSFQIIGYKDGKSSWAVAGAGQTYAWSWPTLKRLLA